MNSKFILYAVAALITIVYIVSVVCSFEPIGISSTRYWRLLYMFFHVGALHAAANVLCLTAIARSDFRVPSHFILAALAIAACAPMGGDSVTVGCSGVCYALLGAMSWQSIDVKRFHTIIALFLVLGALPVFHVNYMLHAFCYIEGVIYGLICKD